VRAGGSVMYETVTVNILSQGLQNAGTALANVPTGANLNGVPGAGDIARAVFTYAPSQLNYPLTPGATATIFPLGVGSVDCTTASPCDVLGIDQNFKTPFVSTWTAGIQHAFTNNLSLEVGYVGNHGSRLVGPFDLNSPPAGAGYCLNSPLTAAQIAAGCSLASRPKLEQAARPFNTQFPYLRYINWISNLDRSNYNGLQATLTKRLSHGLSVNAGYTYSHTLDSGSLNFFAKLPQNSALRSRDQEYASSDFDIRHRLTLAVTYAIPGKKTRSQALEGWQINSILTLQSPQPWLVNDTGNDISGSGDFGDRWNFFGNAGDFKSRGPNATPYFGGTSNPKCLAKATAMGPGAVSTLKDFGCYAAGDSIMLPPALGTFGNMGRNIFRDTGFKNVDLSVYKNWKFGERFGAQFRSEFFNVLNHPNFNNPYGGVSQYGFNDPSSPGAFGCGCATPDVGAGNPIIGSGSNRAIQLGLKLIF
jgi:hypothetical protein